MDIDVLLQLQPLCFSKGVLCLGALGTPACVAVSWDAIVCHHRVLGVVAVIPGEHQSTIVSRAWHNIAIVSKEPTRQKVNIVVSRIDG